MNADEWLAQFEADSRRLEALHNVAKAAVGWAAAYRATPGGIMHHQWMAKAEAERDARQALFDAIDALAVAQEVKP